ncbi:MAG: hypothetical protein M0P26_06310 [Bacteroidales bacterium]|nr:hypothetical protein [Bacteroidales bacterium]
MELKTKRNLANFSIWVIIITVVIIALFFFGFILTNTFDLKVFANKSADFIFTLFGALLVIVICGAFLNISLNIGIIADAKTKDLKEDIVDIRPNRKRIFVISISLLILIGGFLFIGDSLTRLKEKKVLTKQCKEIILQCDSSITQISKALTDTSLIGDVPEILEYLGNQKEEFPSIELITSDTYKGQLVFLKITTYTYKEDLKKPLYGYSLYASNQYDGDYLRSIFTTDRKDFFFWSKGNDYKLYYPIYKGGKKYVFLFSKSNRYGKIGS